MKQRTCFIVCPIGEEGSDVRTDADLLHDFIIEPVLSSPTFNMKIGRADKLGQPGIITNQIIHEIETADLVVADLSLGNPNVFYEVAIRHVTRKPFIHLIRRGQRIPFDNAPVRAVEFELTDLRSVAAAKVELETQVQAALEKGVSESPVTMAATMASLKRSGDQEQIALASLLGEISSIRSHLDRITANQIAVEARYRAQALPFGLPVGTANALAATATRGPSLADYISGGADALGKTPASGVLAQAVADLMAKDKTKPSK